MEKDEPGAEVEAGMVVFELPKEKKSTAGAADTLGSGGFTETFGLSSSEIFAFPLASEGGRKGSDEPPLEGVDVDWIGTSSPPFSSSSSPSSPSSAGATFCAEGMLGRVLKTNPGPFPPPKTRSCGGATAAFCFGAGSIDSKLEVPAPDVFCRLGAGRSDSSSSFSSPTSFGSAGSPMAIFLGARLVDLGGGSEILELDDPFDGGGRPSFGLEAVVVEGDVT